MHQLALSNETGSASFFIPLADDSSELHFAGNLKNSHSQFERQSVIKVEVRTLNSFALKGVQLIKVDVEGSELEVLEGARETILRDHPGLLLELLSGTYKDPLAVDARGLRQVRLQRFRRRQGQAARRYDDDCRAQVQHDLGQCISRRGMCCFSDHSNRQSWPSGSLSEPRGMRR